MERYECLGVVGEGSYGSVLKCRQRDSGRLVAIKKFLDSDSDKAVKKIAMREIRLLKRLRHDNLVNLLEVWKRRRRWHLVFEFVERTVLEDLEQNPGGLEPNTGRRYLFQILRAAAFCHQHNIIHRDIKPENVLVSQGGVVKLCDFGFARTMAPPGEGGAYTDYVATRWYRAPELLVGDTKYGKPVDVWAVGCLLVEMLTGQPLFPGDSDLDQLYHIVRCFGNLTAHHQELFYRNPVFSGVRLPECSVRVPLEQRYPALTHTALDLAQRCLQMDPESRAQCSDLLQHPLFTHDSFHIRFMDELNAKIQQDQRGNSTLPKITKTTRREREEGEERNQRGKDKKQPEEMEEKTSKSLPTDSEQIEGSTVTIDQQNASGKEYRKEPGSENSCADKPTTFNSKTTAETRTTSTSETHEIPKTNHPDISIAAIIPKPSKTSDKENRKDLAPSESSAVTKALLNPTLTVSRSSIVEQKSDSREAEPDVKTTTVESRSLSDKMKPGSFSNHGKSTAAVTPRTPKTTFRTEAKTENGNIDRNETANVSAIANLIEVVSQTTTADDKASKSSIPDADTFGIDENAMKLMKQSFTATLPKHNHPPSPSPPSSPPIPPPPSSTPLLFPPPSTPLVPSLSIVGNGNGPGAGLHPGTHSLRCIDRPRQHGGVYGRLAQQSLSSQVSSEKSVIHERSFLSDRGNLGNCGGVAVAKRKSDVRFPDLRSSMLPELRGRDGKHTRGFTKEQRKDKQPIPSIPSTEPQQHGHNNHH
ncbi:cyclin-dependent kinase-like 2 [Centroberyx affinis]|uniref:cyclin-dependent kinase-like 2 n=1 Tax=Centroberyx affinis TaxID=166261 RepID=UPI003A5C1F57